jgi:hypothetical protein
VWPTLGGREILTPPAWVIEKLGGTKGSNVDGIDFRKDASKSKKSSNKSAKSDSNSLNRNTRNKFVSKKGKK